MPVRCGDAPKRDRIENSYMYKTIDGSLFRALLDYGIRNLVLHCGEINDLNIFPVPDGDTGTNMVTTTQLGYRAIESLDGDLPTLARKFAGAVVYGARGNSGVIVSQFLKGFSEVFASLDAGAEADAPCFVRALESGVGYAYRAVSHPTEGTILTVVREATAAVKDGAYGDVTELIGDFLGAARVSLENTPNLLPVLKNAGVVDSGGVGIVCFFEGMYKYLTGEKLSRTALHADAPEIDYSRFHRGSTFGYGYCTELLLQLLDGKEDFDGDAFREELNALGESVVLTEEDGKVKLHVHTDLPEQVLAFAHRFGEFLTLKIENMSVQHSELTKRITVSEELRTDGAFAVVAVAPSRMIERRFFEMGADVVISAEDGYSPSTQDFLDAAEASGLGRAIVFPNNKNLVLAAEQARSLSKRCELLVVPSASIADCYAALAMLDLDSEDAELVLASAVETAKNVRTVVITRAAKDAVYGELTIRKDDVIAMTGNAVVAVGSTVSDVAERVIASVMEEGECDTVTFFGGASVTEEDCDGLVGFVGERYLFTETDFVETGVRAFDLLLSFE